MSNKTLALTPQLQRYIVDVGTREVPEQTQLREVTATHRYGTMQIAPDEGQFLQMLVRILGARKVLELGVFTGYSALSMALGLPAGGRIYACDISKKYTDIGRDYWEKAGVLDRIELRIAPALDYLQELIDEGHSGSFDLIFADAVKEEYRQYYELGLTLLRPGGVIAIDNVLWDGAVVDVENRTAETEAIRTLNSHVHADQRVDVSLVPIGDGLTLARKR